MVDASGVVEKIELTDPNVGRSNNMIHNINGALVSNNNGLINKCSVTGGTVNSNYITGGLAAINYGTISNCSSTASVDGGGNFAGGLVGINLQGALVTQSRSASFVECDYITGGLVGGNKQGTVSACSASGEVSGIRWIGGLVGENLGTIRDSYWRGTVITGSYCGGLVGLHNALLSPALISKCYSAGLILSDSERKGGMIGANLKGISENCFWDSDLNPGIEDSGVGPDPSNLVAKTTTEMQTASTFTDAGWEFLGESVNGLEETVLINEGYGYPIQHLQERANLAGRYGTDLADFTVLASYWLGACSLHCNPCDIIEDGSIDYRDFAVIAQNWGQMDCGSCSRADLTGDGHVMILDLQAVAECWLDPYDCLGGDIDFSGQVDLDDLSLFLDFYLN